MHFGLAIDSLDIDLWDLDLLDTDLDFLDTDIPSKTFCLSPRRLEDIFNVTIFYFLIKLLYFPV